MLSENLEASTQYQDVDGTIAADAHDGALLHDLAKSCGIDTDRFFPLRLSIGNGETDSQVSVSFYVFDKEVASIAGQKNIWEYAKEHDGEVPVRSIDVGSVEVSALLPNCKRLHIVAAAKSIENEKLHLVEKQ